MIPYHINMSHCRSKQLFMSIIKEIQFIIEIIIMHLIKIIEHLISKYGDYFKKVL